VLKKVFLTRVTIELMNLLLSLFLMSTCCRCQVAAIKPKKEESTVRGKSCDIAIPEHPGRQQ